jgi:enterochelin esterase-like enzyme
MSLTGAGFLGLLITLSVGGFAAVVWFWPRWSPLRPRTVLCRIGLLGGLQAVLLLASAVALNDMYGFFSDWSDLAGAVGLSSNSVTVLHSGSAVPTGSSPDPAAVRPVGSGAGGQYRSGGDGRQASPSLSTPLQLSPGTRTVEAIVAGPISGVTAMVKISLPPGYQDPAQQQHRYPVIESFPGYPGGTFAPSGAVETVERLHHLADVVIISPMAQIPRGRDTECVDGAAGDPKVESWLTRDVPAWVVQNLRVRTDRESWATFGVSAGGWCAAMAAMLHPDRYAAAIVLGGYFVPDFGALFTPFTLTSPSGRRYDLLDLAANHPPPVAIWLETSRDDALSYPTSSRLLKLARAPLSVEGVLLDHGGHRLGVWQPFYSRALTWLGTTLPGFAPDRTP